MASHWYNTVDALRIAKKKKTDYFKFKRELESVNDE